MTLFVSVSLHSVLVMFEVQKEIGKCCYHFLAILNKYLLSASPFRSRHSGSYASILPCPQHVLPHYIHKSSL